jgi:hypothetical protein
MRYLEHCLLWIKNLMSAIFIVLASCANWALSFFFFDISYHVLFFKNSFQSFEHFRFTEKVEPKIQIASIQQIHRLPHFQYPSSVWHFVTINESSLTHLHHPKSMIYIRVHSCHCALHGF